MHLWAIILAAGRGERLARAAAGERKQFLRHGGAPLFWRSARTLARIPEMKGLILVLPPDDFDRATALVDECTAAENLGLPMHLTPGGARRQDSVAAGLDRLPRPCDAVLVHDSARPFASPALITRLIDALTAGSPAVIPGLPVTDTVKRLNADSTVAETPDRARLVAVQTPQAFDLDTLRRAHELARREQIEATDDAMLVERLGSPVTVVPGEISNVKITNPEDLALLADAKTPPPVPVAGYGYDVHRYGPGRPMVLAGVPMPGAPQVIAHSDGDVLLHAVTDALLGCLGGGDIGEHFPDTDPRFDNVASSILLAHVVDQARAAGLTLTHADVTLVAQVPKISPHKAQIRAQLARMLGLPEASVNVKATTEEGLGFTGEKKGIKAVALVSALKPAPANP
jgi:2-C-methyl-D-erythritol 4-phosphate cytidylyltransferase/2-C-methyl-D-erythritol 2,4-cyclodiphosphate synthase